MSEHDLLWKFFVVDTIHHPETQWQPLHQLWWLGWATASFSWMDKVPLVSTGVWDDVDPQNWDVMEKW